jgi:hypothetical protein
MESRAPATPHRRLWRTTVDGEPRKRTTSDVATKLRREKHLGAHNYHVGALGDDGDRPEWFGHVRAVMAGLRPDAGKTAATRALQAVEMDASGREGARERGGCVGTICVAGGGLTEATTSGRAAVAAKTEKKKNEM